MGLSNRLSLLAEIIRTISSGRNSSSLIVGYLSTRPMILGSDVIGLIPLGEKFGFITGENDNLSVTQEGIDFMNYVDGTNEKVDLISNPSEQGYSTLDKIIKDLATKYEHLDSGVYDDIQKIRNIVSEKISFAPEISEDYEILLTVSMPPSSGEKIPLLLKGTTIFHNDAVQKVIQNTSEEILISTYTLDVPTFKQLIANLNTKKLHCRIIVGNANKLLQDPKLSGGYQFTIAALRKFLNSHFSAHEIRLVKKDAEDFVSHAKIWLSEKSVLITSANVTINSHSDNFEVGVYSTQKDLIKSCSIVMERVWELGDTI